MNFTIGYKNINTEDAVIICSILNERLKDRNACPFSETEPDKADLLYVLDKKYKTEEYSIYNQPQGGIKITGASLLALLFGTGKMLRTAIWNETEGNFSFGTWRGRTAPHCEWRNAYLSNHLRNTFQEAPDDIVLKYIEDMVLMGYNTYEQSNGLSSYPGGWDNPLAQWHLNRLNLFFAKARRLGMKLSGALGGNCIPMDTPAINKAAKTGLAMYNNEICPNSPGGMKIILDYRDKFIKRFGIEDYDMVGFWPYDQGGCGCPKCAPWGCNGYLKMCEELVKHFKSMFPHAKVNLSTWLFDFPNNRGEWEGLYNYINSGKGKWIDTIMADSHTEFPRYPLEHPLPDGIQLLTFPEISMLNRYPWGGFGANPMPKRFARLWSQPAELSNGGRIYSEGIYEDFNKALYASFFWNGTSDVEETFREYANYELGIKDVNLLKRLVEIMEDNHQAPLRWWLNQGERYTVKMTTKKGWSSPFSERKNTGESLDICSQIEAQQAPWAKQCWRWRIMSIRAQLDHDITTHLGNPSPACEPLLDELWDIYHLNYDVHSPVALMSNKWIEKHLDSIIAPVVNDVLPDDLKK